MVWSGGLGLGSWVGTMCEHLGRGCTAQWPAHGQGPAGSGTWG